jgi:hypothetical protein
MVFPENNTLVLGIGNYLMGDEGVGVYVAQQLAQTPTPSGLDVLDGGTGGFHLMGVLEDYPFVVMVDATLDGLPAGTIRRIEPRFFRRFSPCHEHARRRASGCGGSLATHRPDAEGIRGGHIGGGIATDDDPLVAGSAGGRFESAG